MQGDMKFKIEEMHQKWFWRICEHCSYFYERPQKFAWTSSPDPTNLNFNRWPNLCQRAFSFSLIYITSFSIKLTEIHKQARTHQLLHTRSTQAKLHVQLPKKIVVYKPSCHPPCCHLVDFHCKWTAVSVGMDCKWVRKLSFPQQVESGCS